MRPLFRSLIFLLIALFTLATGSQAQPLRPGAAARAAPVVTAAPFLPPQGQLLFHAAWGDAPGSMVGRSLANESAPEGPMSFALGPDGGLFVLDQVHGRLLPVDAAGHARPPVELGQTTFQDVAVTADGHLLVLDRLVGRVLWVLDGAGRIQLEVPIEGDQLPEGGLVTALLVAEDGVWLEVEHTRSVRVLDEGLNPVAARLVLPGRPASPGGQSLVARLHGGRTASVALFDRDHAATALRTEAAVAFRGPVDHLALVDTDAAGRLVVAASLESNELEVVIREAVGTQRRLLLPPAPPLWEQFTELRLTPAGALYQMVFTAEGVEVRRWTL